MDIEKVMSIGLKVLAGVVVGATVISGIADLVNKKKEASKPKNTGADRPEWKRQEECNQQNLPEQRDDSVGDTLRNVQNGLGKMFGFIQALVGVTDGIKRLFQPDFPSNYSPIGPVTTWSRDFEARGGYGMVRPQGSFVPGGSSMSNPNDPFRFNPVDCGNAIPPVPGAWPGRTPDGTPFWKNNMEIFFPPKGTPHWF